MEGEGGGYSGDLGCQVGQGSCELSGLGWERDGWAHNVAGLFHIQQLLFNIFTVDYQNFLSDAARSR